MNFDLSLVSDEDLNREYWKRVRARREVNTGGGRTKTLRPCPTCGEPFGAREMRAHRSECKHTLKDPTHRWLAAHGWTRAGTNRLGFVAQFLWTHPRYAARTFSTADAETAEFNFQKEPKG